MDDAKAEKDSLLRVIDESGEDYLFPAKLFVAIDVPAKAIPVFRSEAAATPKRAERRCRPTRGWS